MMQSDRCLSFFDSLFATFASTLVGATPTETFMPVHFLAGAGEIRYTLSMHLACGITSETREKFEASILLYNSGFGHLKR